jgi:hypothetical protein
VVGLEMMGAMGEVLGTCLLCGGEIEGGCVCGAPKGLLKNYYDYVLVSKCVVLLSFI